MDNISVGMIVIPTFKSEISRYIVLSLTDTYVTTKCFPKNGEPFIDGGIERNNFNNALKKGDYLEIDTDYILDELEAHSKGFELEGVEMTDEDAQEALNLITNGSTIENAVETILKRHL